MSYVFISHAGPDKSRIRGITDHLISKGLRLWLDRPDGLGYSAQAISDHFLRIIPGRRWEDDLDEALDLAPCVLFLASRLFLEKGRTQLHKEVLVAKTKRTLVMAKIEDVDLHNAPVDKLADIQFATLFSQPNGGDRASADMRNRLDLLVDAIQLKLNERRAKRFGAFGSDKALDGPDCPTDEQLESFFMMLDREREIDELSALRSAVSIVRAESEDRPSALRRRLHEIELPCRSANFGRSKTADMEALGLTRRRALILSGTIPPQSVRWEPCYVPWPIDGRRTPANPCAAFLQSLIDRSPGALRFVDPNGSPAEIATRYVSALRSSDLCIFVHSTLEAGRALEARHAALAEQIGEIFTSAPSHKFRIFLCAAPRSSSTLMKWIGGGSARLDQAFVKTAGALPIDLGDVAPHDLDEWIRLMSLLVDKSENEIEQLVSRAFTGISVGKHAAARLPLGVIEKQLKPQADQWRLRPRRRLPEPGTATRWDDEQDSAIRS